MIIKKHTSQGRLVLACCDDEIIGKVFEEGIKFLDLKSKFYDGDKTGESDMVRFAKQAYIINAVGIKCIDILLKEKIADKKDIGYCSGIPYVQLIIE
ncbi:MAG: DUF424 family protein [Nanoarchaeota archaeon]|nr:DUF424 family protein [Nanoarchaeota archaeon]